MPVSVEGAGAGNLHDIASPQTFRAEKLNVAAASAEAFPRPHREVLHTLYADAAKNRNTLRLHKSVIGHHWPLEFAQSGIFAGLGSCQWDRSVTSCMGKASFRRLI